MLATPRIRPSERVATPTPMLKWSKYTMSASGDHDADEERRVVARRRQLHRRLDDHQADGDEDHADRDGVDGVEDDAHQARHHQDEEDEAVEHRVQPTRVRRLVAAVADVHRRRHHRAAQRAEHRAEAVGEHRLLHVVAVGLELEHLAVDHGGALDRRGGLDVLDRLDERRDRDRELDGNRAEGELAGEGDARLPVVHAARRLPHLLEGLHNPLTLVRVAVEAVAVLRVPAREAEPPEGGPDGEDFEGDRELARVDAGAADGEEAGEAEGEREEADEGLAHHVDEGVEAEPDEADAADRPVERRLRQVPAERLGEDDAGHLREGGEGVGVWWWGMGGQGGDMMGGGYGGTSMQPPMKLARHAACHAFCANSSGVAGLG